MSSSRVPFRVPKQVASAPLAAVGGQERDTGQSKIEGLKGEEDREEEADGDDEEEVGVKEGHETLPRMAWI